MTSEQFVVACWIVTLLSAPVIALLVVSLRATNREIRRVQRELDKGKGGKS